MQMTEYIQACNDENIKFKLYIMRHFGLHPEIIGKSIIVPDIEKNEAEHLLKVIGKENHSLSADLTEKIKTFILGI